MPATNLNNAAYQLYQPNEVESNKYFSRLQTPSRLTNKKKSPRDLVTPLVFMNLRPKYKICTKYYKQ